MLTFKGITSHYWLGFLWWSGRQQQETNVSKKALLRHQWLMWNTVLAWQARGAFNIAVRNIGQSGGKEGQTEQQIKGGQWS